MLRCKSCSYCILFTQEPASDDAEEPRPAIAQQLVSAFPINLVVILIWIQASSMDLPNVSPADVAFSRASRAISSVYSLLLTSNGLTSISSVITNPSFADLARLTAL